MPIDKARPVRTLQTPYKVMVLRAEPEYEVMKRKQVAYEFAKRTFTENPSRSGAYAPED